MTTTVSFTTPGYSSAIPPRKKDSGRSMTSPNAGAVRIDYYDHATRRWETL